MKIDRQINAQWIATVNESNDLLKDHSLIIHQGQILDILPTKDTDKYQASAITQAPTHLITPGFINAHTHASMSLLRGLADDLPLMTWLTEHIWPAEQQWVNEEFVTDGSRLAIAEMLLGGTTCFNDMYFFPEVTAQVAQDMGIRANIGLIVIDFPSAWAKDADDYIKKGQQLHQQLIDTPLINCCWAPHAPYSVSNQPLKQIHQLANSMDIPIHIHLHETQDEVEQGLKQHNNRPIERLDQLKLLNHRLLAVHMTQLNEHEIDKIATQQCHIIHCPESNLKLASGFCPVHQLQEKGINVALGTDGAASNNDLDMIGEMRTTALLGKGVANNASALQADTVLRMATINGAKALGIDQVTGSLEVGKSADILSINLNDIASQPVYHPISQLIYATSRHQVQDVWVAGQQLVKNHQLTEQDEEAIKTKAQQWRDKISST